MRIVLALPLVLTFACASMSSSTTGNSAAASRSCGQSLVPAIAYRGATVYEAPDNATLQIASIGQDTPVCVSTNLSGYNFRRVQLADGKTGYVEQSQLSM